MFSEPAPLVMMKEFKDQLLRWNPQINLISRQSTDQRIDRLIEQGQSGIGVVAHHLQSWVSASEGCDSKRLNYFDLGSGGGVPGIVWHCGLAELGFSPTTCLVEPRSKRAWFLDRLGQITGIEPFHVVCQRWGDDFDENSPPCLEYVSSTGVESVRRSQVCGNILISLKALKLTDKQVLAGLSRMGSEMDRDLDWTDRRLLIARYHPPGQLLEAELSSELGIPPSGDVVSVRGLSGKAKRAWVDQLSGKNGPCASLVFSEYCLSRPD